MRRLLLGLVVAVATLVPNFAMANDQAIARHIMSKLQLEQQRGSLKGFHVDMRVDNGTVWYEGFVADQSQKDLILRTAQRAKHLGVVQVVDDIVIQGQQGNAQAIQASALPQPQGNLPLAQQTAYQEYSVPPQPAAANFVPQPNFAPQGNYVPQPQPRIPTIQSQAIPAQNAIGNPQQTPLPLNAAAQGPIGPVAGDAASLPGYSWPSYAAHPNYSAVSYPQQYSASAWPYIGPFYPYPQVPLGWRKVTLEWDDGWWWLDFNNR